MADDVKGPEEHAAPPATEAPVEIPKIQLPDAHGHIILSVLMDGSVADPILIGLCQNQVAAYGVLEVAKDKIAAAVAASAAKGVVLAKSGQRLPGPGYPGWRTPGRR